MSFDLNRNSVAKKYVYRFTEEEAQFIDLALQWMHNALIRESKEPFHHLERAKIAAYQMVMVRKMTKRMHAPDEEIDV